MAMLPSWESIDSSEQYDRFLRALYTGAKPRVQELEVPPVRVLSVTGSEPPGGREYQDAIGVLYGIGYTLKMGLRFGKLARPADWFDYKVGALETLWWAEGGAEFDITNSATLRWQAFLMVPAFVTERLVNEAQVQARAKHPELPWERAALVTLAEGPCVQVLHVGPYDQEQSTIARLHAYAAERGLAVRGRHHEIYLSDPRRTRPEKLRTVIRQPVAASA